MKRILYIILAVINAAACEMESRLSSINVISGMEVHAGDRIVLDVSHSPVDALVPAYHYRSNNRFVASVNDQGVVVCHHVGTCTIMVATADTRFSTSCEILVKPNSNLFCEPTLDFNLTKTSVKLKEINRTIVYETATMLVFQGDDDPVRQVAYRFDENQKLIASVVQLSASVTSELTDFMTERYDYLPTAERNDLQIWRGYDLEIVKVMIDNAWFIVYHPFSGKSTVESAIKTIETVRNNCK